MIVIVKVHQCTDLQSNSDFLGERPLWEGGLDQRHGLAGEVAPLRPHLVALLLDA